MKNKSKKAKKSSFIDNFYNTKKFSSFYLAIIMIASISSLLYLSLSPHTNSQKVGALGSSTSVAVSDTNVYWSPYTWLAKNGNAAKQATTEGSYVKIGFTGTSLGLTLDTSIIDKTYAHPVTIDTYIDGSPTAIVNTFDLANTNQVQISNSLSDQNHYAIIYLSTVNGTIDRWNIPQESLTITSFQLDDSAHTLPLAGSIIAPSNKKYIFFGDSITEGVGSNGGELSYAGITGRALGAEYGQVGYGGTGWSVNMLHASNMPNFYDPAQVIKGAWQNYDLNDSRFIGGVASNGYIDGSPDAVFINLGTNDVYWDATIGASSVLMNNAITPWINDIRTVIGPTKPIFVIVPFVLNNTIKKPLNFVQYKKSYLSAINYYRFTHRKDKLVFTVDLGATGWKDLKLNSLDGVHPNNNGSYLLSQLLTTKVKTHLK